MSSQASATASSTCLIFVSAFSPPAGDNLSLSGVPENSVALAISHGLCIVVPVASSLVIPSFISFFVAFSPCFSLWFIGEEQPAGWFWSRALPVRAVMGGLGALSLLSCSHSLKCVCVVFFLPKLYHAFSRRYSHLVLRYLR